MSTTAASICDFGQKAIDFDLLGIDGNTHSLASVKGEKGTMVMFICNHCPYVRSIADRLAEDMKAFQNQGIGVIAIMSNDANEYPEDSFENMKRFSEKHNFSFPYVIDETQKIGRAYDAKCTPDFFGYNANLELQYRGRLDNSGASQPKPESKHELLDAMEQVIRTQKGPTEQIQSIGCSIKWRNSI